MIYLLSERYSELMNPLGHRKQRLTESLAVQQLFRDVEDEEAWVREKGKAILIKIAI